MERVETTWLFDKGADAHMILRFVWTQLGELELQETWLMLRGANAQGLGALGTRVV